MEWTRQLVAVAIGGAGGAVVRFLLTHSVQSVLGRAFPWGTLAVNALGSLLLGVLYGLLVERFAASEGVRALTMVGFLGAMTTFSTFAVEAVVLVDRGEPVPALLYVMASVMLCLVMAWAGLALARQF